MTPTPPDPSRRAPRIAARLGDERGVALVIALLATILLTALGVVLVLVTTTETRITANYRDAQQTLYAADAGIERAMQDLLLEADWNLVLTGAERSGFFDSDERLVTLADGSTIDVEAVKTALEARQNLWGANNPVWRWYGRGLASAVVPNAGVDSSVYLLVLVGDDPSETDGDPLRDGNGVLTLHVEAFGPGGSQKALEVTVSRTDNTEIERGYIAQRGQEELNQRARKRAVEKPEQSLTEMRMSLTSGTLAVVP